MELCLGTVQFGMQYGIASAGRPDYEQAEAMLDYAVSHGIKTIDTAGAYGEAEKIVGAFLKNADRKDIEIITKITPNALYNVAPADYYDVLRQSLKNSLKNLQTDYVDACLFHNAECADNEAALEALSRLKKEKLAKKTGVSVYLPQEFARADASPYIDLIQAPYNLLDVRLDGLLKKTKKEVHARSVFLQGLLLMDAEETPPMLSDVKPYLLRRDSFCEYNNLTRPELMLAFVKTQPKIDKLVFGVDNLEQLKEIEAAFNKETDPVALRELSDEFAGIDERIIMPNLWHGEYK